MRGIARLAMVAVVGACAPDERAGDGDADTSETTGGQSSRPRCDDAWESLTQQRHEVGTAHSDGDSVFAVDSHHLITRYQGEWQLDEIHTDPDTELEARAVWGSDPAHVWVIHPAPDSGNAQLSFWDGSELAAQLSEPSNEVHYWNLWGSAPDDVWLVGRQGCIDDFTSCDALLLHYDGDAWSPWELPGMDGLSAIWGRAHDDVFIVGQWGQSAHFDGDSWTIYDEGGDSWYWVHGDDDEVWAYGGWLVRRWTGDGWELLDGEYVPQAFQRFVTAGGELWASSRFHTWHWNGTQWTELAEHDGNSIPLAVDDALWVADRRGDGETWFLELDASGEQVVRHRLAYVSQLRSPVGRSIDEVYALGGHALGYAVAGFDGQAWRWLDPAPSLPAGRGMWMDGTGRVWLAGLRDGDAQLWSYRDAEIEEIALPDWPGGSDYAVWAEGPDHVWVAGGELTYRWDGESWLSRVSPDAPSNIRVFGDHVYLHGSQGVWTLSAGVWNPVYSGSYVRDFDAAAADSLWMIDVDAGDNDYVVHWDGERWDVHALGRRQLCAIQARAPDDVYVLGFHDPHDDELTPRSLVLHYDGRSWTRIDGPPLHACAELHVADDGIVVVQGDTTHTLRCE